MLTIHQLSRFFLYYVHLELSTIFILTLFDMFICNITQHLTAPPLADKIGVTLEQKLVFVLRVGKSFVCSSSCSIDVEKHLVVTVAFCYRRP